SGVPPVDALGLRRDDVLDAELGGDRLREESKDRGCHDSKIAGGTVPLDQCSSPLSDARADFPREILVPPPQQLGLVEPLQRREVELGEFQGAGFTSVVARNEVAIGGIVANWVERALFHEEVDPLLVAVVSEQRVVEIE